jgi:hypothetical protein
MARTRRPKASPYPAARPPTSVNHSVTAGEGKCEFFGESIRKDEQALADLLAPYEWRPSPELARMIEQLQAEIAARKRPS